MNDYLMRNDDLSLVLMPHIYKDLDIIHRFIAKLAHPFRRTRVAVAPYLTGENAQEYIFDLYRKCDLVMGMRFHTNVCGIGLNVPTIGFITYPQIDNLYMELGLSDRALKVNEQGFKQKLASMIDESFLKSNEIKKRYAKSRSKLLEEVNCFHNVIKERIPSLQ